MDLQLEPEELLQAGIIRLAIRDACQEKDTRRQDDARRFLREVAPRIARRAELPALDAESGLMPVTDINPLQFPSNSLALMVLTIVAKRTQHGQSV